MKRLFAFVLLLIFAYNFIGNYAYIMLQKYHLRKEMIERIKEDIPSSELTSITMTSENKTDFDWRDTNEFKYEGVMYDVVRTEKVNSETTVYHCLTDHLEMKLLTQLEAQKNKNSNQDKNSPLKEVLKVFLKVETLKNQQLVSTNLRRPINIININFYNSLTLEVSSPPPNYM